MDLFISFDQEDLEADDDHELSPLFDALDVNCILSIEDYKELMSKEQPGISDWKDYPVSSEKVEHLDVRFTFDKATREAWKNAKEEFNAITSNARKMIGMSQTNRPSDKQILSIFFGEESRFAKALMSKLEIDYDTMLKWLHDIFLQAVYQVAPSNLYKDKVLKSHVMLNEGENSGIWEQLATVVATKSTIPFGRREEFCYEELQAEYNKISRGLAIVNREQNIEIVVDDDKVFAEKNPKKETFGLKWTTHVKDNRKGYVCHCAATTSTLVPISIKWEQQGESSHTCIETILRQLFKNSGSGYPDLRNVTLFSDRGYWTPTLVYWLLSCGAFIVGTLIRAYCWPMTYCQEKKDHDKRTFLDTKGPPTLFLKRLQSSSTRNQCITIGAFRSGTENISLALSSKHHENQWDCILFDPRHHTLYDTRDLKKYAFSRVDIVRQDYATECHIEKIMANVSNLVKPLTISQGSADWKYARRFSFTSATAYDVCKLCLSKLWHLYENKPHWRTLKAYLDGAFPFEPDLVDEQMPTEGEQNQALGEEDTVFFEEPGTVSEQASYDIHCLNMQQLTAEDLRCKPHFNKIEYLEAFISHVVRNSDPNNRKKMPTTLTGLKKMVNLWLDETNEEKRKYFFLKMEGLHKAMVKKFGFQWKSERFEKNQKITEKDLLEQLGLENFLGNNDDVTSKKLLLTALLKQSFFPSLKGEAKEAASIGHKLEEPLCRQLFQEVPSLKAAFRAPLVEKIGQPWVKGSADFLTITDDDGLKFEVTEIKTRVSVQAAASEHQRVDRVNAIRHITIDAASPQLKNHIMARGEAMQLLHHSLTYDCEFVRHVAGGSHGEIISSTRVRFSAEIREAYAKCLQDLKDSILPWAYGLQHNHIPEEVVQLADTESLKDIVGGRYGLIQQFSMWQALMGMEHPLPPFRRILPLIHAEWNVKKTASDTITKMIDGSGNRIIPPNANINANTLATARILNYALVSCHKLRQFFSASPDLPHETLQQFRNAANHRMTYKDTIRAAILTFRSMVERKEKKNLANSPGSPESHNTLAQRVRIQGNFNNEKINLANPFIGKTPMRNAKQKYETEDINIPQSIHDRRKNCTGPPVFIVPQKANERLKPKMCFVCGNETSWMCLGCHHYFCMASRSKNNMKRDQKYAFFEKKGKSGEIIYEYMQMFCWHQSHQLALVGQDKMRMLQDAESEVATP